MVAGLDSQDRKQLVDKVTILHAGENLEFVVRPLAEVLEKSFKLEEKAEYARFLKSETDIADFICKIIDQDTSEESKKFLVIISELFILKCSENAEVYQKIKSKLCSQGPTQSHFALVAPINTPAEWSGSRCINLSAYIRGFEDGNLVEAILQQWFGPQAKLPVLHVPKARVQGPDKIRIIHAMTSQEDQQKYLNKLTSDIEDVANPANKTIARLNFKQDSIAETLLSDLEKVSRCADSENIKAVILWSNDMLSMLKLEFVFKETFVDIICDDSKPQKLFAHFLFGIDFQQMCSFSQRLGNHLLHYHHMVYIESSELARPIVDYTPFAELCLSFWTGQPTPSTGTISLPAEATGVKTMAQPVNHGGEINTGHNRIAASGFPDHTTADQYITSGQDITSGWTVPDAENLDEQLNAESQRLGLSDHATTGEISSSNQEESHILTPRLLSHLSEKTKRGLRERLDPNRSVPYWRDLAGHFKVDHVKIDYWRDHRSGSPTENLIEFLISKEYDFTVGKFIDGLKEIERNDVFKFLEEAVAQDGERQCYSSK